MNADHNTMQVRALLARVDGVLSMASAYVWNDLEDADLLYTLDTAREILERAAKIVDSSGAIVKQGDQNC